MGKRVFYERNGVEFLAPILPRFEPLITDAAIDQLGEGTRLFRPRIQDIRWDRITEQARYDAGAKPEFGPVTKSFLERRGHGRRVAPLPAYLMNRKSEGVCPSNSEKMSLYNLNASEWGNPVALLCIEDTNAFRWDNGTLDGLLTLYRVARRTLEHQHKTKGRIVLVRNPASLMMRPPGMHLDEPRVLVDGEPIPAFLFATLLHVHHNGRRLEESGIGTDFYFAKLTNGDEAALGHEVLSWGEQVNGLTPNGSHVSVLFEHLLGVLNIHEIIDALESRFVAGNTGWLDYLASLSRVHRYDRNYVMPDPGRVDVTAPCMKGYLDLVVQACHQRGAMAIGGTATQIATKGDQEATERSRQDVRLNAGPYGEQGFDGGWFVYEPFGPEVLSAFKSAMDGANQLHRLREDAVVTLEQLLEPPPGAVTHAGLRENAKGSIVYRGNWLAGTGAVSITYYRADDSPYTLMEDAATGERKKEDPWKHRQVGLFTKDDILDAVSATCDELELKMGRTAYMESTFVDAAMTFEDDVLSEQPSEYFPPDLLKMVWAEEQLKFSRR